MFHLLPMLGVVIVMSTYDWKLSTAYSYYVMIHQLPTLGIAL